MLDVRGSAVLPTHLPNSPLPTVPNLRLVCPHHLELPSIFTQHNALLAVPKQLHRLARIRPMPRIVAPVEHSKVYVFQGGGGKLHFIVKETKQWLFRYYDGVGRRKCNSIWLAYWNTRWRESQCKLQGARRNVKWAPGTGWKDHGEICESELC